MTTTTLPYVPGADVKAPTSWTVFRALLRRDAVVGSRNLVGVFIGTAFQPLMLTVMFGYLLPHMGLVSDAYKTALLPGVIAVTLMLSSLQAVSLPLLIDFGLSNQIEARLLAPTGTRTLVAEKIVAGIAEGTCAAFLVLPIARLIMGPIPGLALSNLAAIVPVVLLGAAVFAALGLVLGTAIQAQRANLLFGALITPLVTFGCAYYPWAGLARVPVLQVAVLVNPLVYVAEALRGALTPTVPHMPIGVSVSALVALTAVLWLVGQWTFDRRAVK
jgi:ABC-2 type transport system permease protein